jgi:glycolate oxidase
MHKSSKTVAPNSAQELQELILQAQSSKQKILLKENLLLAPLEQTIDTIIIDLNHINRLVELDHENCTMTIDGGVNFLGLQQDLIRQGFFFPIDTFASSVTSLAYNVLHNLPSYYLGKYGDFRKNIVGMEAVLFDGSLIKLGGKNIKNVTGLDLMGLLIGSKETLGLITQLVLRFLPAPEVAQLMIIPFENLKKAAEAAYELTKNIVPAKLAIYNQSFVADIEGIELPAKTLLALEIDGSEASLHVQAKICRETIQTADKSEGMELSQAEDINLFWQKIRYTTIHAYANAPQKFNFSCNRSKLADICAKLDNFAPGDFGEMSILIDGAVGTGFIIPSANTGILNKDWVSKAKSLVTEQYGNVLNSPSFADPGMGMMHRKLRQIFDPNQISFISSQEYGGFLS